jgi:hypothetical protein
MRKYKGVGSGTMNVKCTQMLDLLAEPEDTAPKIKPHKIVKQDITKDEFLANLGKVCRPIGKESNESDLEKTET